LGIVWVNHCVFDMNSIEQLINPLVNHLIDPWSCRRTKGRFEYGS
jgi:hypothetical protein